MKARRVGITLDKNADFNLAIGVFGDAGPIDITGYAFSGKMRSSTDTTPAPIAVFSFAIRDQASNRGIVDMTLSASQTSAIPASISDALEKRRLKTPYVFDVLMTDTNGKVSKIVEGNIYVSPTVS